MAALTVIVVNWNTRDLLAACLRSVVETTAGLDVETVVVDNASTDGSAAMVGDRFPTMRVIANRTNLGFARANNQAIAATDAPALLLLNSDAQLQPGTAQRLLACLDSAPRAALVGAQLRGPAGEFQHSHTAFPTLWQELMVLSGLGRAVHGPWYPSAAEHADRRARPVDWVSGACLLARRTAFEAVGGFDEAYFFYGEEMDLCYRLRGAGWEIWYEPEAVALHRLAASAAMLGAGREEVLFRGRLRFFRTHYGPRAARRLGALMVACTLPKIALHSTVRRLSGGRRGRPVISLPALRAVLAEPGTAATSIARHEHTP